MALLGAVKAQTWCHAEDTVPVTESVQGQAQQQQKWAAQPVCFLLPSGVQPGDIRAVVLFSEEKQSSAQPQCHSAGLRGRNAGVSSRHAAGCVSIPPNQSHILVTGKQPVSHYNTK